MSEFLSEAVVKLVADTRQFVKDFEKAVAAAQKQKVTLLVVPSMKGFREALRQGINTSKRGVNVDVPVRPDMTGFRTALVAAVKSSQKGVFAEVGVRVGAATAGAAAAATGGGAAAVSTRSLNAEQAAARAVEAGLFARRQITGLIDEQDKRLARVARQDAAIVAAQELQKKAIAEQNALLQQQGILIEQRARAEREVTRGAFEKEAARRSAFSPATREAEAQAAKDAAEAASAAEVAAAEQLANKQKEIADKQNVRLRSDARKATDERIAQKQKEVAALVALEKNLGTKVVSIRDDIAGIGPETLVSGKGREADIRKQITVLTHAQTEAENVLKASTQASIGVTTKQSEALIGEIAALKGAADAALVASKNQTKLGHTIDNVRRAAIAQVASITGLRGAALTAASAFIATSAAIISLKKAVDLAAEMESKLAVFQVTAGATAEQMEAVHERAIELGKDITLPAVSAADAATALTELSKAGLSVKDSIDGAKGVLQLATAANISFEQATLLSANALNSFGLAGEDAVHVADVLANAANQSQGSIVDMGVALQQSSAVIRQAGIGLEEGVAALTLFARAGLRGSDAGTSLRTALIRLINPSDRAAKLIRELGLQIRDASGAIDLGVFQQFADATRDMSAAQRDQALAIIFGQDAIRGAAILVREGNRGLEEQIKNVNKAGTAQEVASARTSGYAGAVENLKNQIEAVAEEIGAAFLPPLTEAVDLIADSISFVDGLTNKLGELRKVIKAPFDIVIRQVGEGTELPEETPEEELSRSQQAKRTFTSIVFGGPVQQAKAAAASFRDFKRAVQDSRESLEDLLNLDLSATTTIAQARDRVHELVQEIRESKGNAIITDKSVRGLKELQENLQGGDAEAKAFAVTLGELILEIQDASTKAKFPKIEIPDELLGPTVKTKMDAESEELKDILEKHLGEGFHDAGLTGNTVFWNAFRAGIEPNAAGAGDTAAGVFVDHFAAGLTAQGQQAFADAATRFADEARAAVQRAIKSGAGQVAGTERAQVAAQLAGDTQAEINALRTRERVLKNRIARINQVTGGDPKDAALKARTEAQKELKQTIDARENLEKEIKSDAEKKAADVKKAQDEADQAVLKALFPAARKLETRALIAQGTKPLQDNIRVAQAQIKNNLVQINTIDRLFKDREQAAKLIADLRDENIRLNQQITSDTQGLFDAQRETFEVRLGSAEAEDNIGKQISLIRSRIKAINRLIAVGKAEGQALQDLKDERAERRRQLEALQDEQIQDQIALAQSIFDLTGNKNPLIKALNKAIAETQADINAAKKAGKSTVKLRTQLNEFLKERKDLLEDAADQAKQGTTAFDLLQQFTETFNQTAGNLVGPDQPFVSPSDFTKTIQPFLVRKPRATGLNRFTSDTAPPLDRAISDLIAALDRNTNATQGNSAANGDPSFSMPNYVNITGQRALAMQKFWEARGARDVKEG